MEIPEIKAQGDKFSIHFRAEGMKMCLDVVFKNDSFNNQIEEFGLDFKEFHTFKAVIKTDLVPGDIFGQSFEQLAIKAFISYSVSKEK